MMRLLPLLVLLSACAGLRFHDRLAMDLLAPLSDPRPARIAVVPFSGATAGDAAYENLLREGLTTAISRSGKTQVIERGLVSKILQEHRLTLSGAVDPKSIKEIGRLLSVDALVTGTVLRSDADRLEINARLIEVETGRILSAVRKVVKRKEGPARPDRPLPAHPPAKPSTAFDRRYHPFAPRHSHQAVVVDGDIYVVGGGADGKVVATIERFDPKTKQFQTTASLPQPITCNAIFARKNSLFLAGGCMGGDLRNGVAAVYELDMARGGAALIHHFDAPRTQMSWAEAGDWTYFISGGGRCPPDCRTEKVDAFNAKTREWKSVAPVPEGRRAGVAAALGGKIYFIGGVGQTGNDFSKRVDRYDPATDAWTRLNDFPSTLMEMEAAVLGRELLVLGGLIDGVRASDTVWRYEEKLDRWTAMPPMPLPRWHHAAAVLGRKIFVFGGYNDILQKPDAAIMVWDADGKRWDLLQNP